MRIIATQLYTVNRLCITCTAAASPVGDTGVEGNGDSGHFVNAAADVAVVLTDDIYRFARFATIRSRNGRKNVCGVVAQRGTGTLLASQRGGNIGCRNLRVLIGHGHLAAYGSGREIVVTHRNPTVTAAAC